MQQSIDVFPGRAALVVAHPGHELRVHHWMERARPVVFVLTDGSGSIHSSRLASTTAVLERAGARPGSIYGRLSDRDLYRALLDHDYNLFESLVCELVRELDAHGIDTVAGDAVEGFNPGHDTCRLLLNAAVERLAALRGLAPANLEFPLDGAPDDAGASPDSLRLTLDDVALARKLEAARGYPEMADELERAVSRYGTAAFRVEHLRPVSYGLAIAGRASRPPFYEVYGERKVAEGVYREVIRLREHLEPLAAALTAEGLRESAA
ncbi:MAG TPA: hypothetical protein VIW92_04070 [Thermoanaerobaculia bacterium]